MGKSYPPDPHDDPDVEPVEFTDVSAYDSDNGQIGFSNIARAEPPASTPAFDEPKETREQEARRKRAEANQKRTESWNRNAFPGGGAPRAVEVADPVEAIQKDQDAGNGQQNTNEQRMLALAEENIRLLYRLEALLTEQVELLRNLGGLG